MKNKLKHLLQKLKSTQWKIRLAKLLLLFSLFAPFVFTRNSVFGFDFTETGAIGDTVNGLMGPFIAIAAALLTYAAFIIQKEANDLQREATNEQIKRTELEEIESRIFNLIDIHRKNVDDLRQLDSSLSGQESIAHLCASINRISFIIDFFVKDANLSADYSKKDIRGFAFLIVSHGETLKTNNAFKRSEEFKKYTNEHIIEFVRLAVTNAGNVIDFTRDRETQERLEKLSQKLEFRSEIKGVNYFAVGYMNILSRYFRQIFQIIKYIDSQNTLNNDGKYEYAKILRSSLSSAEQELLFNNIISPYGKTWIKNGYVEKYKVFKNIPFYNMRIYTPVDFLRDELHITQEKLPEHVDMYDAIH